MGCADTGPFQPKPNTPFRIGQSRTLRAYSIFCPISRIPEFWNFSKFWSPDRDLRGRWRVLGARARDLHVADLHPALRRAAVDAVRRVARRVRREGLREEKRDEFRALVPPAMCLRLLF